MPEQHVLLYDVNCNFCMVITDAILSWDRAGRIRAAAIQDPEGERLLPDLTPEQRLESFHLIAPDGTIESGGAALPSLFSMLPFGKGFALALRSAPPITDSGYKWVARNRIKLSKPVPSRLKRRARARLRH